MKGDATWVDIIIASNRSSPFLQEAVGSVVNQTWTNWRLTLVDDGSPDPEFLSQTVAGLAQAKYIRQEASGVSAARNRGLAATNAPLVAFLDDDDVWLPTKLEHQVGRWLEAPHHVGVFHGGTYIDEHGGEFGEGWDADQTQSRRYLSGEVPLPRICTLLVRRDACDAIGAFDRSIGIAEDIDLIFRLVQRGEFLGLTERLVRYRRHSSNVSQAGSLDGRKALKQIFRKQIEAARRNGDEAAAILLTRHLRSAEARWAEQAVNGAVAAIKNHELGRLHKEVAWALTTPIHSVRAGVRKFCGTSQSRGWGRTRPPQVS